MADEDDVTIPRAALNKMMKEILPHVRVASDSRELILNCCTEFIHLVSSEANEICNKQTKKTIAPEHVLDALDSLGFGDYLNDCKSTLEQCKTVAAKKRRGSNRLENLGIPQEELLRQQQELFEKARLEQAAIEQQEWLQLQAAQMQQEGGQYPSPGMMEQLPAGQPGMAGPVQGIAQPGVQSLPSQTFSQPLHQPWVDQKAPVASQGSSGSSGMDQTLLPGAAESIPADMSIKKEEPDTTDAVGPSHGERAESGKGAVAMATSSGQGSSGKSEAQSPSTVIKSEPSE